MNGDEVLDYNGLKYFYNKLKLDPSFIKSGNNIPSGLIAMWSGTEVPDGWVLCNGENDTPDLSDKFIVGTTNLENNGESISLTDAGSLFTAGEEISFYKLAFIMKIDDGGGGFSYKAGDGISIDNNTISIKNPVQGIISQDDYDKLPDEDKNKGVWFIKDNDTLKSSQLESVSKDSSIKKSDSFDPDMDYDFSAVTGVGI